MYIKGATRNLRREKRYATLTIAGSARVDALRHE
jgi:hypothetical protein